MGFPDTRMSTIRYHMRLFLVNVLFLTLLSFVNGCSSYQKGTLQSGAQEYEKTGLASYYAQKHQYRKTASGEIFNNNLMTAAHKTLPFGTDVLVKNLENGRTVKVTINDRGPFIKGRIIDLTRAAFSKIENLNKGCISVEIMVVD